MTDSNSEYHIYEREDGETASKAVLAAVEAVSGESLLELPPLHESIDTDALNALFESSSSISTLSFRYEGYEIVIDHERVRIRERT